MYANVKVGGRGVVSPGGKSPRWVIVRGMSRMRTEILGGKSPRGGDCPGGKMQVVNIRELNGGGYKS